MANVDSELVDVLRIRDRGVYGPKWIHLFYSFPGSGGVVEDEQKEWMNQRIGGAVL